MTTKEFLDYYHKALGEKTAYFAYLDAESEHLRLTGQRKYASYGSFKTHKSNVLKAQNLEKSLKKQKECFKSILLKYVPEGEKRAALEELEKTG